MDRSGSMHIHPAAVPAFMTEMDRAHRRLVWVATSFAVAVVLVAAFSLYSYFTLAKKNKDNKANINDVLQQIAAIEPANATVLAFKADPASNGLSGSDHVVNDIFAVARTESSGGTPSATTAAATFPVLVSSSGFTYSPAASTVALDATATALLGANASPVVLGNPLPQGHYLVLLSLCCATTVTAADSGGALSSAEADSISEADFASFTSDYTLALLLGGSLVHTEVLSGAATYRDETLTQALTVTRVIQVTGSSSLALSVALVAPLAGQSTTATVNVSSTPTSVTFTLASTLDILPAKTFVQVVPLPNYTTLAF